MPQSQHLILAAVPDTISGGKCGCNVTRFFRKIRTNAAW